MMSAFGTFSKLFKGLSKTRHYIADKIRALDAEERKLGEDFLEKVQEILLEADVGVRISDELVQGLQEKIRSMPGIDKEKALGLLKTMIFEILSENTTLLEKAGTTPEVVLIVGVNGGGKTTTAGKLAYRFLKEKKKVLLSAADTFRAAASEQLRILSERAGAEIIMQSDGADPAAVVFDSIRAAKRRSHDYLIVDTAGRLHTKSNLMKELEKIVRVAGKEVPGAPHEVLLVIDATTGQNGLSQAKEFLKFAGITGIVLTKLDGTAKGGVALGIFREMSIPIRYIGVGEGMEELVDFSAREYAEGLLGEEI
jgi:fused signal recognition particle receptor